MVESCSNLSTSGENRCNRLISKFLGLPSWQKTELFMIYLWDENLFESLFISSKAAYEIRLVELNQDLYLDFSFKDPNNRSLHFSVHIKKLVKYTNWNKEPYQRLPWLKGVAQEFPEINRVYQDSLPGLRLTY